MVGVEAQCSGLPCFVSDTVTREVQLSELVDYLPIHQGVDPWVAVGLSCIQTHKDISAEIRKGGFCVKSSAQWLCDFYESIVEKVLVSDTSTKNRR